MRSGEVAWALQNPNKVNPGYAPQDGLAWGQAIDTDPAPALTADSAKRMVKVTFSTTENGNYAVAYGNPGGKVELPLIVNDNDGNYARIWRMDDGCNETKNVEYHPHSVHAPAVLCRPCLCGRIVSDH